MNEWNKDDVTEVTNENTQVNTSRVENESRIDSIQDKQIAPESPNRESFENDAKENKAILDLKEAKKAEKEERKAQKKKEKEARQIARIKKINAKYRSIKPALVSAAALVLVIGGFAIGTHKDTWFGQHDTGISNEFVNQKIQSIGELVTCECSYTNSKTIEDSRELAGVIIPFTKHTVDINYNGTIKVAYDVSEISTKVDNLSKKIYVKLPKSYVSDNYIDIANAEISQQNNFLNPIDSKEVAVGMQKAQEEELANAIENGLFETAEEKAQSIIRGLFLEFNEYSVEFL